MKFAKRNINKTNRNGVVNASKPASTMKGKSQFGNYLPAIPNGDGTYTVSVSCVRFLGDVFGEKEIAAWKVGNETGGQSGNIIIDTALSPISENPVQNKVIYTVIGDMSRLTTTAKGSIVDAINEAVLKGGSGADVDLSGYATILWVRQQGYLTAIPSEYITEDELSTELGKLHTHANLEVLNKISESNYQSWNKVVSDWNSAFYFDAKGNLRARLNLIGEKEITAWKVGEGGTAPTPGLITIVDNLFSASAEAALSANQGRILKQMIEEKSVDLSGYATILWVQQQGYLTKHQSLADYATMVWVRQQGYLTAIPSEYITEDELSTELGKLHTHANLEVLNKISESNYQSWNKVVSDWNSAFYFDAKGNLRARLNLIGEKEITAWKVGEGGTAPTPGLITIVDNLSSTSAEAALSANQGRILKQMIEEKSVDLSGYATMLWVQQQGYLTSYINNYLSSVSGNGNGMVYFYRNGLGYLSLNLEHTHSQYLTKHQSLADYATMAWVRQQGYITGYTNNYVSSATDNGTNGNYLVVTLNRAGLTPLTLDLSHSHSQYLTAHQSLTHLANKDGSNVSGTWHNLSIGGNAATASNINGETPQLAASASTNNEIKVVNNANSSIVHNRPAGKNLTAISKALDFRWYDAHYQIGALRGDSYDSLGWGVTSSNDRLLFRVNENGAYVGEKEVYHKGNLEISDNFRKKYDVDLTGLSPTDFYPVCFAPSVFELDCEIHSPNVGESASYNQNHIHFLATSKGWSDTKPRLMILSQGNHTDKEITIGSIGRGKENGCIAVWLRGGMKYNFTCNRLPILRRGNYADGNEFYAYGTNITGGTNRSVEILWTNDDKRENYSVIQCINGQTIIPGNLRVLGDIVSEKEVAAYKAGGNMGKSLSDDGLRMEIKKELSKLSMSSTLDDIRNVLINIGGKL